MDTGIIIVLLMLIIVLLGFLIFNTKPTEIKLIRERERERPITKERIIVMEPETSIWSWPWSAQWPWWQSTRPGYWGGYGPYHGRFHH
jgi:hypothetical protein